jgi:hypothetical protein
MKSLSELRKEIMQLADQGAAASKARDIVRCIDIRNQLDPLMRELGERLDDNSWNKLADEGANLLTRAAEHEKRKAANDTL